MTAQISDRVVYRGKDYAIAGICGCGLFTPLDHGICPGGISTACYRGYHCRYEVADGCLKLRRVNIGLRSEDRAAAERGTGPRLFGKVPRRYPVSFISADGLPTRLSSDFVVAGLDEAIALTGGLLLGAEFIPEMYVHMGFQSAYKFREVYELIFAEGRLTEARNRSAEMAEFRDMLAGRPLEPPGDADDDEIQQWIVRCFRREYRW